MKAIVQDRYGASDVLRVGEIEPPAAGDGEVLVRVQAASVNARDWHVMRGDPYVARMAFGLGAPKVRVRGTDFAGRVEAVGAGVTRFRPGDEVYGEVDAAFAEYVRVPAAGAVDRKPANVTFEQAAAVPLAGNTALMGLRDEAGVRPGQRVLVNGASGGVGTFAVQLAKAFGAHVTGVCSTRNVDLVRSLGADRVIDYTVADFVREGGPYDVVFDLVGNRSLAEFRRVLTPTGTLVLSGGGVSEGGSLFGPVGLITRGRVVSRFVRHRVRVLTAVPGRENLATLRELIESGAVIPVIDRTFPLGEAAEAVRYLEMDHARAKVVITV
ncbi:NAD(P)-dependent alcohol dehydrogenase [Dactylosporangium sp. NPDC050588]|uniref:NAD(P)-dependent alcohol dehydrogenase n=1 Tax=Dactylosporangium sp. NPDC050588 TaxID=3157211 RepID=UPI0033E51846